MRHPLARYKLAIVEKTVLFIGNLYTCARGMASIWTITRHPNPRKLTTAAEIVLNHRCLPLRLETESLRRQLPEYGSVGLGHAAWPSETRIRSEFLRSLHLRRPAGKRQCRYRDRALRRVASSGPRDRSGCGNCVPGSGAQHSADQQNRAAAVSPPLPSIRVRGPR